MAPSAAYHVLADIRLLRGDRFALMWGLDLPLQMGPNTRRTMVFWPFATFADSPSPGPVEVAGAGSFPAA